MHGVCLCTPGPLHVCVYMCVCVCVCVPLCVRVCYTDEKGGKVRKRQNKTTQKLNKDAPTPSDSEHTPTSSGDREGPGKKRQQDGTDKKTKQRRESLQSRIVSSPVGEDYLHWKETVLSRARAKVTAQALNTS